MVETCKCPEGCGVDLVYEGDRQWVCPICNSVFDLEDVDVDDTDECLCVEDAALIWASHGKDEDYTYGYTEEELEEAL
uniref:hypothetical protein n=1 Tax=Agathobacter sp. TaxID=2021311 RepID=UPI004055C880